MASFKIDELVFDKLAEILQKHNLAEIEYKKGDIKFRIVAPQSQQLAETLSSPPKSDSIIPEHDQKEDYSKHPGALKSPMVGMCYLAPEPNAPNYVSLGDNVQEGQPLLIIEAMKVMNIIKAPKSGNIIHIAIQNAAPVEFGQLLLVIG
ncbi:MAG: acetyl-CoA carboxylase, biotin carboxyl carrier protein [Holosporales bacterium]|jgi:acetyl-CoA carboxylase biotin carboxyl carrier protein|nr:acetyl-CoA carboxylase, biotin carboxyl carrier protein [Holosporales bacterium]